MLLKLEMSSKPSRELFLSLQKQLDLISNKKWSSVLLALQKGSRSNKPEENHNNLQTKGCLRCHLSDASKQKMKVARNL